MASNVNRLEQRIHNAPEMIPHETELSWSESSTHAATVQSGVHQHFYMPRSNATASDAWMTEVEDEVRAYHAGCWQPQRAGHSELR